MKNILPVIRNFCLTGLIYISSAFSIMAQTCPAPTNLNITNLTATSGLFQWNNVTGSTGYVLRLKPVSSNSWRRISSGNNTELVSGLIPNTNYMAKVRSDCGGTEGLYSPYIYFTTPSIINCGVSNVYLFTSDSITANTCIVGWHFVSHASYYNVQYRIRYSNSAWMTDSSTTTSLHLTGLNPHTQYEFQVQTVCSSGHSAFSPSGIFTTKIGGCGTPSNLSAQNVTVNTATLAWNTLQCASYYIINYHDTGQWITDTSSVASLTIDSLSEGTQYEFGVRSVDSIGNISNSSSLYSFTTASLSCGVPINLSANSISTNDATLTWPVVSGAISYNIRYRLAGAQSWLSDTTSIDSINVTGLSPDNAYEFQVQSVCQSATSSFSAMATFLTQPNANNNIPVPDHIVICIMENKAFTQMLGGSLTPHINALSNDSMSAVFVESYGITHPSQPNYIHLFSGASQGVTSNNMPSQHFTTPNLARELINAGRTYTSYSESLPSVGFDGYSSGDYARKHNPVANWMGTGPNQVSSTLNQPFTNFPANFDNLPTVSIVVPNLENSMHNGSLGTALVKGDNWLFNNLNQYIQWAKTHNSLFILTSDEDDGSHANRVLTIFTGEMVNGGTYNQPINHHTVLRTIAEMYGLNFIGASANEVAISGCWTTGFRKRALPSAETEIQSEQLEGWKVYPNPSYGEIHAAFELPEASEVTIRIFNNTGSIVFEKKLGVISKGSHVYDVPTEERRLAVGFYFMNIEYGSSTFIQKFLVSQ